MLLFLDDSYEPSETGFRHVLGGFAVSEAGHRELVRAVRDIKARRFVQDQDLDPDAREALWQDRFIVGADPAEVELKASLLLSSSILRRRSPIALTIANEVLLALRDSGAAVLWSAAEPPTMRPGVTPSLLAILDAVQAQIDDEILLAIDGTNPNADRAFVRRFSDAMLAEEGRRRFPTVSPIPFVLDTHASPGLQVADLVAHILLNRLRPVESRKPLDGPDALIATMEIAQRP